MLRRVQPIDWAQEIGGRIRQAREAKGMARPALADLLTLHVNTLRGYEASDPVPWAMLPQIADALDVDLRWLLHGHEFQDPLLDVQSKLEDLLTLVGERGLEGAADEQDRQQQSETGSGETGSGQ